ncbi:MAG: hypothetical protein JEZ03_13880 [Bacteroidales bacterium]|nr:hypothetical protein [Bacteroidales bacterium]
MQLDYTGVINAYGDNIVRLYDFDKFQAQEFLELLKQTVIADKRELDLSTVEFIEPRNCNLTFRISDEDEGITSTDNVNFYCDMTIEGYKEMLILIEPFCKKDTKACQYLYDVDSLTDLLFTPSGSWEAED